MPTGGIFRNSSQTLDEISQREQSQSRHRQGKRKLMKAEIRDDLQEYGEHAQGYGDPKGNVFWWG
jgi:hypothetical protein